MVRLKAFFHTMDHHQSFLLRLCRFLVSLVSIISLALVYKHMAVTSSTEMVVVACLLFTSVPIVMGY